HDLHGFLCLTCPQVYTVGPDYAHAEARKSPALDGKVERDSEGKEVRYPVMLSAMEKLVARKVCLAFKQTVCGFDLLRANGHSYVCDVNGFSFVKNSMKYYDDCAKILGNIVMRELAPQFQIPWSIPTEAEDIPIVPTTSGTMMELRCVIAVIRHGDRTPKQKMKMEVRNSMFFDLFEKYGGYKTGKLKLKKPKQLQEVLDITRLLLAELGQHNDCEIEEKKSKLEQLKTVLEMCHRELLSMPAVKRFSVSFAKYPTNGTKDDTSTAAVAPPLWCTAREPVEEHHVAQLLRRFSSDLSLGHHLLLDGALAHHLHQCSYHLRLLRNWLISGQEPVECLHGFEGCSMVPSIYPLETLHNSLSLKQVNEFLSGVCESAGDPHTRTTRALSAMFAAQPSVDSFIPQKVLSSSIAQRARSDRPPWYSSGPSSTVSSAGPSSPTTADTSPRFSFGEKISLTPQSSEETHSLHVSALTASSAASQCQDPTSPAPSQPAEVPLTPNNSPEEEPEPPAPLPEDPESTQSCSEGVPAALDPVPDPAIRPPCSALAELALSRMEGYCLPGSLPVLLELRESSSEAGSSSQTPQSPEGPDEFFDTQESMELWMDSPENPDPPEASLEGGETHIQEP
ncbi:inositol hexakisphosphate and diphosphoinositol-pentakisphosphate kinase 1-like, partial [Notolabrus celidotus]|uniref:inositol hexakisphosphate and diphosphoinositol-pentakisphosphate kinase 1-like n=1 Tax=Notolabrus celidotus TaxID=1203425 RepID=UPI00148F9C9C